MATIESEIATGLTIKKTHMAQALKGDDYPTITESLPTYTSGKITLLSITYTDGDFQSESYSYAYWASGESVTINSVACSYNINFDGNVRQITRTISGGDVITSRYAYTSAGILLRFDRQVSSP